MEDVVNIHQEFNKRIKTRNFTPSPLFLCCKMAGANSGHEDDAREGRALESRSV